MVSKKSKNEHSGLDEELDAAQNPDAPDATDTPGEIGEADPLDASVADASGETGAAEEAEQTVEGGKSKSDAAMESAKQAAEAARAKLKEAFAAGRKDPILVASLIDTGIKKLTALLCPDCFDKNASRAITFGHYSILLLALLCLVMGLILGIRTGVAQIALSGAGGAVLLLFAQFLAVKSFSLFEGVIANHPTRLSGPGLLEILAILNILGALGGIALIVTGVMNSVNFAIIASGLLTVIFPYLAAVLLMQADKQLNVNYDAATSLGEQLIGIVTVKIKITVRLMPYIFGLGLVVCTILCVPPLLVMLIKGGGQSMVELTMLLSYALMIAFSPFLIYIWVILLYLVVDLLKSILSLNRK